MNATTTDNLPETILSLADFSIIFDPDADYDFAVIDQTGEVVEGWDDRDDAIEDARGRQAELDAERKDERLESLREQIGDLASDCEDEAKLRMILAILKK